MRDIRALGDQVAQVRRVGLRTEVIVPLIAVLILIVALVLSALGPATDEVVLLPTATGDPSTTPLATTPSPSQTPVGGYPSASGYPIPDTGADTPTPVGTALIGTPTITDTAIAGGDGYPVPDDLPEPLGPPPSGGVPPENPTPNTSGYPPSSFPTPELLPTSPVRVPSGGGSYPSPATPRPTTARPSQPVVPTSRAVSPGYPAPTSAAPQPGYPAPTSAARTGTPVPGTVDPGDEEPTTVPEDVTPVGGAPTSPTTPAAPTAVPPTPLPPTPTPRPADVLSGNLRWTAAQSPIVLTTDQLVAAGSSLTIDPGVEVRLAPDVRLSVAGTLRAPGTAAAPVRFVGTEGRWDGIVGTHGSTVALDHVQIRQAGRSGTAVSSTGGSLAIANSLIADSGGGIVALGSTVDLRTTRITGNDIPGPAVNVAVPQAGAVVIAGNVIGGNNTPQGAPQLLLRATAPNAGNLAVEGNLFVGGAGPGLLLDTSAPLAGTLRCNTFNGGTIGLQISTNRPSTEGFNLVIDTNAFAGQSRFGAAGSLAFNFTNNWWNDASGPLEASRNPGGRGVPVGVTLTFDPWLTERPSCAPQQ